jgi:hypothetical protein
VLVRDLLKYRISVNMPFHVLMTGPCTPVTVCDPNMPNGNALPVTVFENALDLASCPFIHTDAPVFDMVKQE